MVAPSLVLFLVHVSYNASVQPLAREHLWDRSGEWLAHHAPLDSHDVLVAHPREVSVKVVEAIVVQDDEVLLRKSASRSVAAKVLGNTAPV
jgi:hypothetical protein